MRKVGVGPLHWRGLAGSFGILNVEYLTERIISPASRVKENQKLNEIWKVIKRRIPTAKKSKGRPSLFLVCLKDLSKSGVKRAPKGANFKSFSPGNW